MSVELLHSCLTADHKQFSNFLAGHNDNLDLRSNSQNEHEQDFGEFVKGQLCLLNISNDFKKESHYHNFELWGRLMYLKECDSMAMFMVRVKKCLEGPRNGSICSSVYLQYLSVFVPVSNLSIAGVLQGNYLEQWQVGYLLTAVMLRLLLPWKPN